MTLISRFVSSTKHLVRCWVSTVKASQIEVILEGRMIKARKKKRKEGEKKRARVHRRLS